MIYKTQCEAVGVCSRGLSVFNFFPSVGEVSAAYDFRDPKEKSRLEFYFDLLEKYNYPIRRIEFDVAVSQISHDYLADIVVFRDNERKIPYIVVDCLKQEISDAEFEIGVKEAIIKAEAFGADYAVCASGNKKRMIKLFSDNGIMRQETAGDLPIGYGAENSI